MGFDRRRAAVVAIGALTLTIAATTSGLAESEGGIANLRNARRYCERVGGDAVRATPYWGTNSDRSQWLKLADRMELCRFEMTEGTGTSANTTRIYVDLPTIVLKAPTLAGVAYLSKVPPVLPPNASANPATYNCNALGASSQFGSSVSGGGWVADDDPTFVISLCMFPDRSAIDEWGIFYYTNGTVRGKDLATVMRYEPEALPPIFPGTVPVEPV